MRHIRPAAALIALFLVAVPVRMHAWGFTAHKLIMDRAIALLPPDLKPFYEKYRVTIVEHAVDPDTYRSVGFTEEEPRHFLDMDSYGAFPFPDLPHDYNEAIAKRGLEFVTKNGTLPWRVEEMDKRLVDSFKQVPTAPYGRANVQLFSSVLAHYISDASQPFHATANYDGQLTGQRGIHSRFETELVERYQGRLALTPKPVTTVTNARDFAFATLTDSFKDVGPILEADKAAAAGRDAYDDAYFEAFFDRTRPMLQERLSNAVSAVASLITSAWIDAGRPAMPPDEPARPPRPIRR